MDTFFEEKKCVESIESIALSREKMQGKNGIQEVSGSIPLIAIVQAFGGTPDSTMFFTPIIMMILGFITLKFYKNAKA